MLHRLPLLVALALPFGGCASAAAPAAPSEGALVVPMPVPEVALATLHGDSAPLSSVTGGRVALVTLWATWCEACEKEMDALNRLQARTEGRDLVIIGVAVGDGRAAVADFAQRRGLRYVNFVDEDFHFVDALGERTVPATLILDRQGRIVFRGKALDGASLAALQRTLDDGR